MHMAEALVQNQSLYVQTWVLAKAGIPGGAIILARFVQKGAADLFEVELVCSAFLHETSEDYRTSGYSSLREDPGLHQLVPYHA
jgi:hypothetical protein